MLRPDNMLAIVADVADAHGLDAADLLGRSRIRFIVGVRDKAIRQIHATGRYTTSQIGRTFGRDHTSILAALDRDKYRAANNERAKRHRAAAVEARA